MGLINTRTHVPKEKFYKKYCKSPRRKCDRFVPSKKSVTCPAELNTEVRIIYDEDVRYNCARCEGPNMKKLRKMKGQVTASLDIVYENTTGSILGLTY